MQSKGRLGRYFTEAARRAAIEARRRKRDIRLAEVREDQLAGFVMRASPDAHSFRWEIRRWGVAAPIQASEDVYRTPQQARTAMWAALRPMTVPPD